MQAHNLNDAPSLLAETERVLQQSIAFNSTFLVDAQGFLRAVSPRHCAT